jgi:hypothetical protein
VIDCSGLGSDRGVARLRPQLASMLLVLVVAVDWRARANSAGFAAGFHPASGNRRRAP